MQVRGLESNSCYVFELPDPPAKKLIYGWDKPIEEQYWVRPYQYTDEEYYRLTPDEQDEVFETEDLRCREGFWFMNKGEPVYLTGDNYFYLTHWTSQGKHFSFIKNQTLDFYFYDFCEKDPKCFGSIELKPRQEGSTAKKLAIFVNRAIRTPYMHFAIQSKTGDDAKNVNFKGITQGYNNIPHMMKPRVRTEDAANELRFSRSAKKNTNKKGSADFDIDDAEDKAMYLDSWIDWKTTSVNGYDGKHIFMFILDEYFKWNGADVYETWKTVRRALGDKFEMWGKAFLLSTMGTDDEKEKVSEWAIQNGKKLWDESSYLEKDELGYTKSGLYRWFVYTTKSKRGTFLNKYGEVDEAEVLRVLMIERKNATDYRSRVTVIRQDPINPQEALATMSGADSIMFPNIHERLLERYNYLKDYEPTPERPVKYLQGKLEWVNNERFGKVKFIADAEGIKDSERGRFAIAYFPDIAGHGMANRVKEIGQDMFMPFADSPFVVGLDNVEYEEVQYGEGSKPAFHIKCKYNIHDPELSDVYCLEYFGRPEIPLYYEDVFKALFFYGAKINIERQSAQSLFFALRVNGMKGFIMKRPSTNQWNKKTDKDTALGNPTSARSIQAGLEYCENYFSPPNPEFNDNEKDNLKYFWFDRTLKQFIDIPNKDIKKYDLVSSMIQTEFASQLVKKRRIIEAHQEIQNQSDDKPQREKITAIDYLFPIYKNGQIMTHGELNRRR